MHKMIYDYHPSLVKISMPMDLPELPDAPDSRFDHERDKDHQRSPKQKK